MSRGPQPRHSYIPAYGGEISLASDYRCGFDPEGVFVRRDSEIVFRSLRVRQRAIGAESDKSIVKWTGADGASISGEHIGLGDEDRDWQVVARPMRFTDIPCIDALRELCTMSVRVGRPMCWT